MPVPRSRHTWRRGGHLTRHLAPEHPMASPLRAPDVRLLAGVLFTLVACGAPDPVSGNSLDAVGHWTLQTYNGRPLPAKAVDGGPALIVEVMNGALDLGDD